jgi:hypothetical protein
MKSRILGFDFRVGMDDKLLGERWPEQRRSQYLLRPDVVAPLSVDTGVWPSLFDFDSPQSNATAYPVPANDNYFHHQGLHLWADLPEMRRAVLNNTHQPKKGFSACFTLEDDGFVLSEEKWRMAFEEPTVPAGLDARWALMGYDVADRFFTSGLSNCGYNVEEAERARATWRESINTNGLFSSADEARRFKEYSDTRVQAHAPFYIFGIYEI